MHITELKNKIIKLFADDGKLYKKISSENNKEELESDLHKISAISIG